MKKIFLCLLILSILLIFILLGCRADITKEVDEIEETEKTSIEEVTEDSEKELSEEVNDKGEEEKTSFISDDGKIEFILDNVERTKKLSDEIAKIINTEIPKKGYDFMVINLIISRITDGHIYFKEKDSALIDKSGIEFVCSCMYFRGFTLLNADPYDVSSARIEYSEGTQDTIIFEIPESSQPVKVKLAYIFFKTLSKSGQPQSEEERYIDIILN